MILTCYYDLRFQPLTFDFVIFLAGANAYREQIKAIGLEIKIIVPDFKEREIATNLYKEDAEIWKFQNIILKLPALLSKVISVNVSKEIPNLVALPCYPPPLSEIKSNALNYLHYSDALKDKYRFFHSLGFLKRKFLNTQRHFNVLQHLLIP